MKPPKLPLLKSWALNTGIYVVHRLIHLHKEAAHFMKARSSRSWRRGGHALSPRHSDTPR